MLKATEQCGEIVWLLSVIVAIMSLGSTAYLCGQNKLLRNKLQIASTGNSPANKKSTSETTKSSSEEATFTMKEIGTIQSPFPQRAGCPRQGTLAPHVRSHLILHPSYSHQIVDGLEAYSHIWIIFSFHLNPRGKAKGQCARTTFTAQKIKPPRAPTKMGILATRAPHRPNPVGLSLCLLEDITTVTIHGRTHISLSVRGLDLVDGTPVYDIKPYVPCDRLSDLDGEPQSDLIKRMKQLRVPCWVSADDELAHVKWSDTAMSSLEESIEILAPLYTRVNDAASAISEIVAQDPRAVRDGRGKISTDIFQFTFGQLRVSFHVHHNSAEIVDVVVDDGDMSASPGSYPYNLAQRRLRQTLAGKQTLFWENPVREGVTEGLFELRDGTTFTA